MACSAQHVGLSSRQVRRIAPVDLAFRRQASGPDLVIARALAAMAAGLEPARLPQGRALFQAAISGILKYALLFRLYLTAIRGIPVSRAAVRMTRTSVFGVAGAVLFPDESVAPVQAAGAGLILLAILSVRQQTA